MLYYLYTSPRGLLRVDDDGLHVFAEHLGDGHVVALVGRLAHVNHAVVLYTEGRTLVICNLLKTCILVFI